jgi:hypothetical protein
MDDVVNGQAEMQYPGCQMTTDYGPELSSGLFVGITPGLKLQTARQYAGPALGGLHGRGRSWMPASRRANRILPSRSASRASMILWACGDPAPCMDSAR